MVALVSRVPFEKTSDVAVRFSKKLGRCIGWGCFSKKAGTEYDDEHGDHFPDDELFGAVGGLMKMDFKDREIDIEHLGAAQGSIVTTWAMTEDVAKSLKCDTGGNYGVLVDFEPSADLLKSIEDGEMFSLSMFGTAIAEPVAKSAAGVEVSAAKRKRVMRDVKLTKWAVCKSPAHVGAEVALVKNAPSDDVLEAIHKSAGKTRAFAHLPVDKSMAGAKKWLKRAIARHERHMDGSEATDDKSQTKMMDEMKKALEELDADASMSMDKSTRLAKRTPAATSIEMGHQHTIYDADEKDGYTSSETSGGSGHWHSHSWIKNNDGTISVLMADGHTHTLETEIAAMSNPTDLAKAQTDLATANTRCSTLAKALLVLAALPVEQAAFAKRLKGDELEAFLGKSDADRAALATPVHKSTSTGEVFYASDDARLVTMAKAADATAVELAKAREAAEAVRFEKRAEEVIKHWPGTLPERAAIMKAVDGIADEALRNAAIEKCKAADVAFESITKRVGHSGSTMPIVAAGGPEAQLDQLARDIQKAAGGEDVCSFAKAYDQALSRPDGAALYAQIEAASRPSN